MKVFLILSSFNIIALIALVFFERKNPEKVLKWISVLLFLPILGFILYVFFGKGPRFSKKKRMLTKLETDRTYLEILDRQFSNLNYDNAFKNEQCSDLIKYNIKENKSICTYSNDVEFYTDIRALYDQILKDIESAKVYVHVLYFIIKPDAYGKKLVDALAKKASEGVKVRLVYDDFGSLFTTSKFFKPIRDAGGEVQKFFNTRFKLLSANFNYRNHRKIVVVDGKVGYIGGSNIAKEYVSEVKKTAPWRDSHLRISGHAVTMLNARFLQDFNYVSEKDIKMDFSDSALSTETNPIQIVSSGPDSFKAGIESAYVKAIYSAKHFVYIQTPYLILDEAFKMALITAARSGVDVRIMIPGKPDKRFVYYSTLSYAEELVSEGVKVFLYEGFLHSKTLCVDGVISSVGTFNIDIRSFRLHFEVTAFVYGEKFSRTLISSFEADQEVCEKLDEVYMANRSLTQRFMERIAILFSPLF